MKKILEDDKSFMIITALALVIPTIIGMSYALVIFFS